MNVKPALRPTGGRRRFYAAEAFVLLALCACESLRCFVSADIEQLRHRPLTGTFFGCVHFKPLQDVIKNSVDHPFKLTGKFWIQNVVEALGQTFG